MEYMGGGACLILTAPNPPPPPFLQPCRVPNIILLMCKPLGEVKCNVNAQLHPLYEGKGITLTMNERYCKRFDYEVKLYCSLLYVYMTSNALVVLSTCLWCAGNLYRSLRSSDTCQWYNRYVLHDASSVLSDCFLKYGNFSM
jgi:hypothetical protein